MFCFSIFFHLSIKKKKKIHTKLDRASKFTLKGSLCATIFSKYTQLLQLKNIFRIFENYVWNILELNVFQNKNQCLYKKHGYFFKMADIDNSKMGLIIIAGGGLLLRQEHTKERRKQRQWVCPWIRKRDSKYSLFI